jgi:hypothetical protein
MFRLWSSGLLTVVLWVVDTNMLEELAFFLNLLHGQQIVEFF